MAQPVAIEPELNGDRDMAADFWEDITGGRELLPAEYVDGFTDGDLELWADVKSDT